MIRGVIELKEIGVGLLEEKSLEIDYINLFIGECIEELPFTSGKTVPRIEVEKLFKDWIVRRQYEQECKDFLKKGMLTRVLNDKGFHLTHSNGPKYRNIKLSKLSSDKEVKPQEDSERYNN